MNLEEFEGKQERIKARIGILYPSPAILDNEFFLLAPEGVAVHITRVTGIPPKLSEIERAAEDLAGGENPPLRRGVKKFSMAYACTSGSFGLGVDWNKKLISTMEEKSGMPVTTSSEATVQALKALNIEKVAVLNPYMPSVSEKLEEFLSERGFTVVDIRTSFSGSMERLGLELPQKIYKWVKQLNISNADGVLISCTSYRALETVDILESEILKPVVTSIQATMWYALHLAGVGKTVGRFGKLNRISTRF
ncbi:MAG: hypothetical protein ACFFC7_34235 [Candidatus Hermodarchaeota archaeon]